MNNKESQSADQPLNNDTAKEKEERYTYGEEATGAEAAETAVSSDHDGDKEAGRIAEAETAASTAAAYSAPAEHRVEDAAAKKSGPIGWIVLSALLAAALIVVLVVNPFGGGSGSAVATVNGENITKDELYDLLVDANGEAALDNLITETLVQQEADAASISITDQDVTDEIAIIKMDFANDEEFNSVLIQNGLTEEDLRDQMRVSAMVRKVLESKTEVTDEEMQTYFDENKAKLGEAPEQVRASHILVATKEEADAILAELKGGADFAETAKAKSTDGSAASGGDLGFFSKEDMVEPFSEAAFALEVDAISEVVQSEFGYHIIKKTDYKAATTANFEEKKELIRLKLTSDETNQLASAWIQEIRDKAKITNTLTDAKEEEAAASEAPAAETTTTE
ncbi:peptidylprolyl isomerase [Paenibacillus soyae]|uniref:Peptidylprolyl isomerase n=1 Tax=Paenibacillus soyae TaxID=2969249 RepID=A0A9X2MLH6_9BACL|nr:peptidylprolyl isomerase [Paenibacillus soyae]MCR2804193.1 peptidylprolyl isomerase [Paenibacillus soyae]